MFPFFSHPFPWSFQSGATLARDPEVSDLGWRQVHQRRRAPICGLQLVQDQRSKLKRQMLLKNNRAQTEVAEKVRSCLPGLTGHAQPGSVVDGVPFETWSWEEARSEERLVVGCFCVADL